MRWSPNFLALAVILSSFVLDVSSAPVRTPRARSRSPSRSPSPPHTPPPPAGAYNNIHHATFNNVNIQTNQPPGPGYTHHSTRINANIGPSVGLHGQHSHGNGAHGFSTYSASYDVNHKWKADGQSSGSGSSSSPGSGQAYFDNAHHFHTGNVDIRNNHYVQGQGAPLPPRPPSNLPHNYHLPPAPGLQNIPLPPVSGSPHNYHPPPAPGFHNIPLPPVSGSPPHRPSMPVPHIAMPEPQPYRPPQVQYATFHVHPGRNNVIVPLSQNGYYQYGNHPYMPADSIYPQRSPRS